MKPVRLFWWSPMRSPRLLKPELESNLSAWMRLGSSTRRPFRNFGDELSPLLVTAVSGRPVEWTPPRKADLVSVGSVFELAGKHPSGAAVWGTGLRGEPRADVATKVLQNLGEIVAVRGPRTREALSLAPQTPLGDPGLLSYLLVKPNTVLKSRRVFVPHFTTWNSREGRALLAKARSRGFDIIKPSLPPLEVLRCIAGANFVLSSSLHGVIVAHSLGVPASLLTVGGKAGQEPEWKFRDYFESIGASFEVEPWAILDDDKMLDDSAERALSMAEQLHSTAQILGTKLATVLKGAI